MKVLDNEQLSELKRIELEMFEEFINVCEELDLRYYLIGGSLLGAVRHKGFIPWDDDIDVGMPREDYEIFVSKAQGLLPQHLFVQTHSTDLNYPMNFAKIRNSNTTFLETTVNHIDMNHGVFIDIFPLDYYPDVKYKQFIFDLKNRCLKLKIRKCFNVEEKTKIVWYKRFINHIMYLFVAPLSIEQAIQKREELLSSVPKSELLANYCGAWGKKEIVPACWYGKGTEMQFENYNVKVPLEYHKWLTRVYGHYMEFPPEEKRVTHHHTDIIDFDNSYTTYLRENEL